MQKYSGGGGEFHEKYFSFINMVQTHTQAIPLVTQCSLFSRPCRRELRPQQGTQSLQQKQVDWETWTLRYKSLLC